MVPGYRLTSSLACSAKQQRRQRQLRPDSLVDTANLTQVENKLNNILYIKVVFYLARFAEYLKMSLNFQGVLNELLFVSVHHSPHSPGGSHGGHGGGGPHSPTSSAAAAAAAGMSHLLQVESSLRGEHPMHGKAVVFIVHFIISMGFFC